MQLNLLTDYAIRLLITLASFGRRMSAPELARSIDATSPIVRNIMRKMREAGLVISDRGVDGGYRLGRPPEDISLFDVHSVMDMTTDIIPCLNTETPCAWEERCPVYRYYHTLQDMIHDSLKNTSLSKMLAESPGKHSRFPRMLRDDAEGDCRRDADEGSQIL